jgi:replicative superfamily II helicase
VLNKEKEHPAEIDFTDFDDSEDESETANALCTHLCSHLKSRGGCLVFKNTKKCCRFDHPKPEYIKTTVVFSRKKSKKCPDGRGYLLCKIEPERPEHCKNISQY